MNVFMHIIHSNSYIHIYIYVYVYTCIYTTYGGFLKWEYLKSDHVSIETHGDLGIPHKKKKLTHLLLCQRFLEICCATSHLDGKNHLQRVFHCHETLPECSPKRGYVHAE